MKKVSMKSTKLSNEAVEILRRACKRKSTRTAAMRDPVGLLAKNGVELPADAELRLYEPKNLGKDRPFPSTPDVGGTIDGELRDVQSRPASAAADAWWRSTHEGCPLGTYPYETKEEQVEVLIWGVYLGGKEWVPDVGGTAFGHWEYTERHDVPLLELNTWQKKIVCLPRYVVEGVVTDVAPT